MLDLVCNVMPGTVRRTTRLGSVARPAAGTRTPGRRVSVAVFTVRVVGQSRAERTWRSPTQTRHVWIRLSDKHSHQPPAPGLVLAWKRHSYAWSALVTYVDELRDGAEPVVVQRWIPAADLRPAPSDPNKAFGLR